MRIVKLFMKGRWDKFFDSVSVFDDDFLRDREDSPPQKRDFSY